MLTSRCLLYIEAQTLLVFETGREVQPGESAWWCVSFLIQLRAQCTVVAKTEICFVLEACCFPENWLRKEVRSVECYKKVIITWWSRKIVGSPNFSNTFVSSNTVWRHDVWGDSLFETIKTHFSKVLTFSPKL